MTKREKEVVQALQMLINKTVESKYLSEYEFGVANGLIISKAVLEDKEPKLLFPEPNRKKSIEV